MCSVFAVSDRTTMRSGHGSVVGASHATVIACGASSTIAADTSFTIVGNGVSATSKVEVPPLSSARLSSMIALSSSRGGSSPLHAKAMARISIVPARLLVELGAVPGVVEDVARGDAARPVHLDVVGRDSQAPGDGIVLQHLDDL